MATNEIEQQLECPICFVRFQTPKMLPCQHVFCLGCLQQLAEQSPEIRCPECRASHSIPSNGVSGFPTSIHMQRMLEASNPPNVRRSSTSRRNAYAHQTVATSKQTHRALNSNRTGYTTPGAVITPSAPPFYSQEQINYNQPQTNGLDGVQLAFEKLLKGKRRGSENIQRNRNTPNVSTHVQSSSNLRTNRNQDRASFYNGTLLVVPRYVRQKLHHLAGRILNDHKTLFSALIITFSVVTVSRVAAGAAKLSSDCPLERQAAFYLFVKACFASFFWGVLLVWNCRRSLERALGNIFVEVYLVLESLFSICWLIVGTVWIMGNFSSIKKHCPDNISNWNAYFINFGFFLTVVDYIGLLVFLFYSGYTFCDSNEEQNEST